MNLKFPLITQRFDQKFLHLNSVAQLRHLIHIAKNANVITNRIWTVQIRDVLNRYGDKKMILLFLKYLSTEVSVTLIRFVGEFLYDMIITTTLKRTTDRLW